MEAASIAHGDHDHHGPPAAHQSSRVEPQLLGMLLFIISEIMIFGAFFTAYAFIRLVVEGASWPGEGLELPKLVAGINTAILVSSSFTLHWAETALKNENRTGFKAGMFATFLLGLAFLSIQINEYVHIGIAPSETAQASIFYGLTGLHGAHVTIGLILLLFVNIRAFKGHYGPKADEHRGVNVPGIYWHFVDVMWLVVYSSVYLI
jgi:cytochrome c oxidase subunit 3